MICETSNRNTNDLQGISNLLAYDLNLHFIAHEHACDSSTVVVTIYKELTIWKASECFPQDLGSDSRQTTCGLRPKTTTTQFSSTATQPNVINQADTARNKEKPLNQFSACCWAPIYEVAAKGEKDGGGGTVVDSRNSLHLPTLRAGFLTFSPLATNGWHPSTFPCLLPSGRPGSGPVLWPLENQPLHNLQGLQVGIIKGPGSHQSDAPLPAGFTPSCFSMGRSSSARSVSPRSPGTQNLWQSTSRQHTSCRWRLVLLKVDHESNCQPEILQTAPTHRTPVETATRAKPSENNWRGQGPGSRV